MSEKISHNHLQTEGAPSEQNTPPNNNNNPDSESSQSPETHETLQNSSDRILDQVFDKLGHRPNTGYFGRPEIRDTLLDDAVDTPARTIIHNFKSEFSDYIQHSKPEYQERTKNTYAAIRDRVQDLSHRHLVGNDTIKVFLSPNYLIENQGIGWSITNYSELQSDFSRSEGHNWFDARQTAANKRDSAKRLADFAYAQTGDVHYQGMGSFTAYDPEQGITSNTFIHVNTNQPQKGHCMRCYISADKTADPGQVLDAWREALEESPLSRSLYYKYTDYMPSDDHRSQRFDDIVIYKYDNIDDGEFKALLQDFQRRCAEKSPDLLPSDPAKMPPTTMKIADGISISGEPELVNSYLCSTNRTDGRHSWTSFVDRIAMLSTLIASRRLGITPDTIDVPGLRPETSRVFREFMLLSDINPDTMLSNSFGNHLPSWANLDSTSEPEPAPGTAPEPKSDTEPAPETAPEPESETTPESEPENEPESNPEPETAPETAPEPAPETSTPPQPSPETPINTPIGLDEALVSAHANIAKLRSDLAADSVETDTAAAEIEKLLSPENDNPDLNQARGKLALLVSANDTLRSTMLHLRRANRSFKQGLNNSEGQLPQSSLDPENQFSAETAGQVDLVHQRVEATYTRIVQLRNRINALEEAANHPEQS